MTKKAHVRSAMSENRFDLYSRKAEEYRVKAEKAVGDYDKAAWLKLAEDWQQLADVFRQRAPGAPPQSK